MSTEDRLSEQWRDIPGFEGRYAVSDYGRVKTLARTYVERGRGYVRQRLEHIKKPTSDSDGYMQVRLYCDDGKNRSYLVHRLVLMAFVGPCPSGLEGCHNDGSKDNNHLSNLRWDTRRANMLDQVAHGTNRWSRVTHCPQGHPYDDENTYRRPEGGRHCRACSRTWARKQRAATRAMLQGGLA